MSRRDCIAVILICLVGMTLRVWQWKQLSIEHFDEGVYASNVYSEQLAPILGTSVYPSRHLYAPPLYPWLCELLIRLFGTPDAALVVNLIFGTLTVPLVWWAARDQLGKSTGLVAAGLCATSDFHIFFSRSALTDVCLGFWMLLAVWLAARGLQSGRRAELIGAGAAAALAWWTKYNGWLAVLIPLGGVGLVWFARRWQPRTAAVPPEISIRLSQCVPRWLLLAGTAALLWSPVVYGLQNVGGYASVAANHKTYLVGLTGWLEGAQLHLAYQTWLGFGASTLGVLGILVLVRDRTFLVPLCVLGVSLFLGTGASLLVLSTISVIGLVMKWNKSDRSPPGLPLFLAMLIVWWIGLTLTTPLYRPYARLSLPWVMSGWLLISVWVERAAGDFASGHRPWKKQMAAVLAVACFSWLAGSVGSGGGHGVRTGMRQVVGSIVHEMDVSRESMKPSQATGLDAAVYVVGEPALYCHLSHQAGDRLVIVPGPDMSVAAPIAGTYLPKFIVTGGHVPDTDIEHALQAGLIESVWEQKIPVSDMVALDSATRDDLRNSPTHQLPLHVRSMTIRVFKIRD